MPAMPVLCVRSASLAFGDRSLPPDLLYIRYTSYRASVRTYAPLKFAPGSLLTVAVPTYSLLTLRTPSRQSPR